MKIKAEEINLHLEDESWNFTYTDHDREIVRAIVFDDDGYFYFVRAVRDDIFGNVTLIETSGGGVESGENLNTAILRELKEELGVEAEIICKIGVVDDYYNLIHRHNINNYYLCKATSFGDKNLTKDEIEEFHLSTLKLTYDEAVAEYEKMSDTKLGRLIYNREMPILKRAKELIGKPLFREMSRKKQALPKEKIIEILNTQKRGVLSVYGENGYPYGLPINFLYNEENGFIYFHSGKFGHKTDAISKNNKVSFCVYDEGFRKDGEWALNISSVIVFGDIFVVEDFEKAMDICKKLSLKFTDDNKYIDHEIEKFGKATVCYELRPVHITGKIVNEA